MPRISTAKLLSLINVNDFENFKNTIDEKPGFKINPKLLLKSILYRYHKYFDLIIDRLDFENNIDDINKSYELAMLIHMKASNEENDYFIDKLLNLDLKYIPESISDDLLEYNPDIYNKYCNIKK